MFWFIRGRRGRGRMVVEFTTTYVISTYHNYRWEFKRTQAIQHYLIKCVSDLRQVGGLLRVLWFSLPIKLTATI